MNLQNVLQHSILTGTDSTSKISIKLRAQIDILLIRHCTCICSAWLLVAGGGGGMF